MGEVIKGNFRKEPEVGGTDYWEKLPLGNSMRQDAAMRIKKEFQDAFDAFMRAASEIPAKYRSNNITETTNTWRKTKPKDVFVDE